MGHVVAEFSLFLLAGSLPDIPDEVVRYLAVALRCGLLAATEKMLPGLSDCSKSVSPSVRQQLEAWEKVVVLKAPKQAVTSTMPGLQVWSEIQVCQHAGNMHALNSGCNCVVSSIS